MGRGFLVGGSGGWREGGDGSVTLAGIGGVGGYGAGSDNLLTRWDGANSIQACGYWTYPDDGQMAAAYAGDNDALTLALSTGLTSRGLVISEDNVVRTAAMLDLQRQANATGDVIKIDNNATASSRSIEIDHESDAEAVYLVYDGGGDALKIALGTDAGNQAIVITEDGQARADPAIHLTTNAARTGYAMRIQDYGGSVGLQVDKYGDGTGLAIKLNTHTGSRGINIAESNHARVDDMLQITRQPLATGHCININNDATGTSKSINIDHESSSDAIYVHSNSGPAFRTGAGDVKLAAASTLWVGTYAAESGESFTGFITIKDAGGTDRKVMICA